jgi:hypothetical protein
MGSAVWMLNSDINRSKFAYKLFSGLLMLGYQTEMSGMTSAAATQHLLALQGLEVAN